MNATQFCGEYGKELRSGRISFTPKVIDRFIETYTYLSVEDFSKEARKRLVMMVMIDLYSKGISCAFSERRDLPVEKIEIPMIVFE